MNTMARSTRTASWMLFVLLLAACAGPVTPPAPAPTLTRALPTMTLVPLPSARPPATPSPTREDVRASPVPIIVPSATPRAHQFEDVDSRAVLAALFPDLKFTPSADEFLVNGNSDWTMWINSRAEGDFLGKGVAELAVIVSNEAPRIAPADIERSAPWGSFLAILEKRDGRLAPVQRSFLFPTSISPIAFDVHIDRVIDFDRDAQSELLITTEATRLGVSSTAGFIYQWNDQAFVETWSAPLGEDNTAAINQAGYYASTSEVRLTDVNGDGMDEIIVDTTRIDYARDAQGLANTNAEIARRTERRFFRWGGAAFVADPTHATPLPPLPVPTR